MFAFLTCLACFCIFLIADGCGVVDRVLGKVNPLKTCGMWWSNRNHSVWVGVHLWWFENVCPTDVKHRFTNCVLHWTYFSQMLEVHLRLEMMASSQALLHSRFQWERTGLQRLSGAIHFSDLFYQLFICLARSEKCLILQCNKGIYIYMAFLLVKHSFCLVLGIWGQKTNVFHVLLNPVEFNINSTHFFSKISWMLLCWYLNLFQRHLHLLVLQMPNVKFQAASLQVSSVKFGGTSFWHGCPQFIRFSDKSDNLMPFGCSSC